MKVIQNGDVDFEKWSALLEESSFSSPFQTPEYFNFFNSVESFSAKAFAVEEHGELKALVVVTIQKESGVKSFFSKRGIIYGGPLLSDVESANLLVRTITEFYNGKVIYLETRNFHNYSKYHGVFEKFGWAYLPYENYRITNYGVDKNFMKLKSEKRRQIRKSKKKGRTINVLDKPDPNQLEHIYEIFYNLYINKIKKPLPGFEFFEKLTKLDNVKTIIIKKDNQIFGCSIVLIDKNAVYDWFRAGNDIENKHYYPSTVLAWEGIKLSINSNCNYFDFMGAGIKGEKYGVKSFKSQFGGDLIEPGRYQIIFNKPLFKVGQIGLKVLSKL